MASYRHLARIAVMQTLFALEFRNKENMDAMAFLEYSCHEFSDKLKDLSFAQELLKGLLSKQADILKILQQEAPQWPVDRIAPVDRSILEIGIYEVLHSKDVPPVVAINEAVEMAKSFGDTNSPKFVNGVLSAVMNTYPREDSTK